MKNIFGKLLSLLFVFAVFVLSANANENSLASVSVNQTADGIYKIILKLEKKTPVKKVLQESGKISIILNSTLPSEPMDIVYDNASALTNVIVQKKDKNNTLISFEGKNINNAQIYIKDLSTGLMSPIGNPNVLFYTTDKKLLAETIIGFILFFFAMLLLRPKSKRYNSDNEINTINQKKHSKGNTLRHKNLAQSKNVLSINSNTNGSFVSARKYMTTPNDLVVNNSYEEEEVRKAG